VGVGQHGVDDAVVHPRLPEPVRGDVGVALHVLAGLVLVEVVEQAGHPPQVLVAAQAAGQGPHDALHGDQVADGGLLLGPLTHQGEGGVSVHVGPFYSMGKGTLDRMQRGSNSS
jgi:hypothetical protein